MPKSTTFRGSGDLFSALMAYSRDRMGRDKKYARQVRTAIKARKEARRSPQQEQKADKAAA